MVIGTDDIARDKSNYNRITAIVHEHDTPIAVKEPVHEHDTPIAVKEPSSMNMTHL